MSHSHMRLSRRLRRKLTLQNLEDRTQPAAIQPLRVALVSDAIAQATQIQAAAANGVVAVSYDADSATLDSLVGTLADLSATHGGAKIGHLGLVAHGGPASVALGASDTLNA